MAKRVAFSLFVVAVVALLGSPAAFAENPTPVSVEAFLGSLQAPATAVAPDVPVLTGLDNVPAPLPMSCTSQCMKCGTNKVKLCTTCNGVVTCGPCQTGTTCNI
jgi:hypothetical protein